MENQNHACVVCSQTSQEVPLLTLEFQGQNYYICPSHFPILIHRPGELVGLLPGVERLQPHQH